MVSRGQVKEFDSIERINVRELFYCLKDYAIELEIKRDFYRDIIILSSPSQSPDKFAILDTIQKLYNKSYKTPVEKLIENYKKEFGDSNNKEMKIRFNNREKKKVSDLIARMPQK